LQRFQQPFLLDPSNVDSKFERVRWRKTWQELERAGLSLPGVLSAIKHLQKSQWFIESTLRQLTRVTASPEGYFTLDWSTLRQSSPLHLIFLFTELLRVLGPTGFAPKESSIQRLVDVLLAEAQPSSTLGGVFVQRKKNVLWVFRELRSCPSPMHIAPGAHHIWWDYRWHISLNVSQPVVLRALGHDGIVQIEHKPVIPLYALLTLPSLWQDGKLLSIALPGIMTATKALIIEVQQQWRRTPLFTDDW
jgi:tRNA(Ile)-lysidine synthase